MIEGLNDISRYILGARRLRVLGVLSSVALLIISLMTIVPACNVSDNTEALSLTAGSTLTFTSNSAVAMVDFSVTDSDGTFVYSDQNQQIDFDISTDNLSGYTLRIKSNGNNTSLTDGSHNITSISSSLLMTAFMGSGHNNEWGYRPSRYNSSYNTLRFYPAPSTTGDVLRVTSAANTSADNYTIGIGVKANYASPAGTYTFANNGYNNTTDGNPAMFILEYVANPVDYIINYVDDVNHNATLPSPTYGTTSSHEFQNCSWNGREQHCESELEEATLSSTIPGSPGRTFVGWCTEVTTLDGTVCSGTTYPAGSQFSIDQTQSGSITLHAVWQLDTYSVDVNVIGSGLMLLEIINTDYGSTTVGPTGGTVNLKHGVTYTFAIHKKKGGEFVSWSTTANGTLGSTTVQDTTYSVTGTATLTLRVKTIGMLYDEVAVLSKGKQTNDSNATTGIKYTISASNSGVYEYDPTVFQPASDASNTYAIYYYRGILDSDLDGTRSTYGSNGDGTIWPNYVKLGDTCWRIVRTTGSGGVKMIYNGLYSSGTTANSCANATTDAQVTTKAFGLKGNSAQSSYWYRNINRVGYTFNNAQAIQDSTTSTSVGTVFGSNEAGSEHYTSTNTTNSNIKTYIEGTWFTNISAYESLLEPSAGYCNDRSVYSDAATATEITMITPYATSDGTAWFGAYGRNNNTAKPPSLTCPRGAVDLYTTGSASDGNKQLVKPVALLTADEASFAGSGVATATLGSGKHPNSFLVSGSTFWLLSPNRRIAGGTTHGYTLAGTTTYGLSSSSLSSGTGVRPVISLDHSVIATPLDMVNNPQNQNPATPGTATNPWVVTAP